MPHDTASNTGLPSNCLASFSGSGDPALQAFRESRVQPLSTTCSWQHRVVACLGIPPFSVHTHMHLDLAGQLCSLQCAPELIV